MQSSLVNMKGYIVMHSIERSERLEKLAGPVIVSIVLAVIFLAPFPEPVNWIVAMGVPIFAMTWAWSKHLRTTDEVVSATWTFGAATGAAIGFPLVLILAVVIRSTPSIAAGLTKLASGIMDLPNDTPAVTGFLLGMGTTICLFGIAASVAVATKGRWMQRR